MQTLERLRLALTPARLETMKADLIALAALIAAISGAVPGKYGPALVALGALATKAASTLSFLKGNREWEASPAGQMQGSLAAHDLPPGQSAYEPVSGADAEMGADDLPEYGDTVTDPLSAGPPPEGEELPPVEAEFEQAGEPPVRQPSQPPPGPPDPPKPPHHRPVA